MKIVTKLLVATILVVAVLAPAHRGLAGEKKPLIQMAILLDTSNSMDGLINQAKSELWKIVNEFATAKQKGVRPQLQVALYEYGNDNIGAKGYVRMVLPLTDDLDKVSEELFALKTLGGSEYCGQVIDSAVTDLKWSKSNGDLKVIFIAGNEPFTQGPVDYRKACKAAITSGIVVNTIHCGSSEEGVKGKWKDGAMLADGRYMHIDQNKAVAHIQAPQDKKIAELGAALNKTYIPYGAGGGEAVARQAAQDNNASSMSAGTMTQRAVFKSSHQYDNDAWDLVDAVGNDKVKLEDLKDEELPEHMRKMDASERRDYVADNASKRGDIQEKIRKLNDERKKFVADKRREMQESEGDTLDSVMIKAVREQGEKRNFDFSSE